MSDNLVKSKVTYDADESQIPVHVADKPKRKNEPDLEAQLTRLVKEDRFWAALAHALGPVMMALLIFGDGLEWLGIMLITGGIYLYFSERSELIKFHARQALAAQFLGTFGWLALFLSVTAIWIVLLIISAILIVVLIGLVLLPLVIVAYPIFALASFILPLGVIPFGAIGAWECWHGRNYRYPYLADWLDRHFGVIKTKEVIIV